jgi:hypothetical protein
LKCNVFYQADSRSAYANALSEIKGTVRLQLRPMLLYIIRKLLFSGFDAAHKKKYLLKGLLTIYI